MKNKKRMIIEVLVLAVLMILTLASVALADPVNSFVSWGNSQIKGLFFLVAAFFAIKAFTQQAYTRLVVLAFVTIFCGIWVVKPTALEAAINWGAGVLGF